MTVPLDRTGGVPGTVRLHVQRARARQSLQPPLFVLAGDGASTTRQFSDGSPEDWFAEQRLAARRPGRPSRPGAVNREPTRDVVAIDLRGSGRSGALDCPALQRQWFEGSASAAAVCAASLGPRRAFYTTEDFVDDVEAVRVALGVPRIALYGAYGGARVALGYARRHPDRVERMMLESPTDAGQIDPLRRGAFQAAPRILDRICGGRRCRGITADLARDVERLAAMLERRPARGRLPDRRGRPRAAKADGFDVLALAGLANPFGPLELPGAVRNALRGDLAPLLRAVARNPFEALGPVPPRAFSWATYAATRCEAPGFPWPSGTPMADRTSRGLAFARGLPAGTFGPFGPRAALQGDVIDLCRTWPAAGRPAVVASPLPPVPTLIVTMDELDAPVEVGRAIAAELPEARVVVSRLQGADSFGDPPSSCRGRVVSDFFAADQSWRTRRWCPGARLRPNPWIPPPMSLRDVDPVGGPGKAGRTLAAVRRTVADAYLSLFANLEATLFSDARQATRIGALRAGSYRFAPDRTLRLLGASLVPGVRVTGRIRWDVDDGRGRGRLRVAGSAASKGLLTLRRGVLGGRLGGRDVRARLGDVDLDRLLK